MRKKLAILTILLNMLFLYGCSDAGGIDEVLNKAKKEGKVVMLELGSVGCIPCEQMKPVMKRLSVNYGRKLEVVFIDVKKDGDAARRFGVYMIPVQVFIDLNGREFYRHIGYFPYEEIVPVLKIAGI